MPARQIGKHLRRSRSLKCALPDERGAFEREREMELTLSKLFSILWDCLYGRSGRVAILTGILAMAGEWGLLKKSGLKGWWALIPCARDYQLGRCAGREPEGRTACVVDCARAVFSALAYMTAEASIVFEICVVLQLSLFMVVFLYRLKIYGGLIEVYGARKRWMWLYLLQKWIPMLLWGWSRSYVPGWKVEEMHRALSARALSGSADVMEQGLTVNLKERSVREFFQKKILLWDIHMYIPQGHMVLLLGGSGAGKTTFVNAVNGYEKAKAEIMLNGSDMYRQYKRMQYETGFVPQQELMRSKDTVQYTLMDAAKLRLPKDVPPDVRRKRVDEVMEIFGLTPVKNSLVQKLSGGQKKRLSVAMELISNPSLFILDEPDSGLDGVMARELMQQLRKVADTGKIVIVITHTPDRVIEYFDDVIVLAKDSARTGRLAFYGSIAEAQSFFGCESMEEIVKLINRKEEGGAGKADEFINRYMEVQHA